MGWSNRAKKPSRWWSSGWSFGWSFGGRFGGLFGRSRVVHRRGRTCFGVVGDETAQRLGTVCNGGVGHHVVDVNGGNRLETVGRRFETLGRATIFHLCLIIGNEFFGFTCVEGRVNQSGTAVTCVARTFQDPTVVCALRGDTQTVPGLQRFGARGKGGVPIAVMRAIVNVLRCRATIPVSGIDLHGRDVPRLRGLQQLGITFGVPVVGFT